MSAYDDDDIEFEFFDEPETAEATRRRRLPRLERPGIRSGGDGPRRPPIRAPTGLVPLARLVGLIAIAIAVVVGLVFWIGSCQGKSKHDEYASYVAKVKPIAQSSASLGTEFANELIKPGLKPADLETQLQQYAQQEQQAYNDAQQIRAPGPLRDVHQQLVDAIELRAKGLAGLADAVGQASSAKNSSSAAERLTQQAQLLTASDIVWDQLYRIPATEQMKAHGVTGVVVPASRLVSNADLVSARSFGLLLQRLKGASTGGTPSGKHGDGIVSVRVTPQGTDLSTSTPTTVKVSAELTFVVTVEDSGDFQETSVPVTLTISVGRTTIQRRRIIPVIAPAEQKTLTFGNFNLPSTAFGNRATVTAFVAPVRGEVNTSNNKSSYPVLFSL